MGNVVDFENAARTAARPDRPDPDGTCEIVIFPGVRIERHDLDLGERLRDSAGRDDFEGLGGKPRPRKLS